MAVMTPRDPLGRAVLRTVLIVVASRSRSTSSIGCAHAADLARDRRLSRGRDVGAGERAPAAHEARLRDRAHLPRADPDPDRLGALLIPSLVDQIEELAGNVPEYAQDVEDFVQENDTLNDLNDKYDFTSEIQNAADDLPSKIGDAAGVLQDIGVGVVSSIFATVTILILSIFMVGGGRAGRRRSSAQPAGRRGGSTAPCATSRTRSATTSARR